MWVSLVIILPLFWKGVMCPTPGYSIHVTSTVRVQEGLCVTIPCTFVADNRNTFSNSYGYWIPKGDSNPPKYIVATNDKSKDVKKTNFHLTGNPDTGDCTLTITDARKEDEGQYHFRFEESEGKKIKYNYSKEATIAITVTDLIEEPIISDPGTVIAGINKTLTCSPPRNCPATSLVFQWLKSNVVGVWKKNSSTVTFAPSKNDHQEKIICEMTSSKGITTRKTILLDVYAPPENMETICQSSGDKYRDIAIAFVSGIILITLIILIYKLIKRKKMGKNKNKVKQPSDTVERPTNEKPEHNAEEATDDGEMDPNGVTSEDDLHYSTAAFSSKPIKVASSQPESEYAEIKVKQDKHNVGSHHSRSDDFV